MRHYDWPRDFLYPRHLIGHTNRGEYVSYVTSSIRSRDSDYYAVL
ncbi:MAG TPA: hypothetical protein VFK39_03630 [Gemmatimonadaceae bacterium]|nr:hypothetical protein [Gemmatimonadaceae bacterium]